jgi:hypothetical protein
MVAIHSAAGRPPLPLPHLNIVHKILGTWREERGRQGLVVIERTFS